MVQGDPDFPPTSGPGEGQVGTTYPPSTSGTSVEIAVGLHPCGSAARAFAASLLNLKFGCGADGDVPLTHEVVNDIRPE